MTVCTEIFSTQLAQISRENYPGIIFQQNNDLYIVFKLKNPTKIVICRNDPSGVTYKGEIQDGSSETRKLQVTKSHSKDQKDISLSNVGCCSWKAHKSLELQGASGQLENASHNWGVQTETSDRLS